MSETTAKHEELGALATAKKVIQEATGGAAGQSYSQVSLMQVASSSDLANVETVRFIRTLAKKDKRTGTCTAGLAHVVGHSPRLCQWW